MTEFQFPLLSLVIFLPMLGAVIVGFLPNDSVAKRLALGLAVIELILTLLIGYLFNPLQGDRFQMLERHAWIPRLHIEYLVGVDGISVLFLPMSAILTLLAMGAGWKSINYLPRFHFALLLVLESVTLGTFCALDMLLFFLFWELTLPPLYFLIGLWGIGAERRNAAMKYTLFMLFGGIPLLFGILILAFNNGTSPENLVFSFPKLLEIPLPLDMQNWVLALLILGFAVKAPLVPLHTWLPTIALEGSAAMTAWLTGLKLGAFGILRFALPLAPEAAVEHAWILGVLGAITLLYAALIALHQTNLRRLLALLSISHVGLIIAGIASMTIQGLQGALLQLLNFSVVASSLMLLAGFIQNRLGSNELVHLGGLAKVMPRLTSVYFLFALASVGLPGTSGFPAELLSIMGILLQQTTLGIVVLVGTVIGAAALFSFTQKAFWGPLKQAPLEQTQDILKRELLILGLPLIFVWVVGLCPNIIFNITQTAAEHWLERFNTVLSR